MNVLSPTTQAELAPFEELYRSYKRPIYGYCLRMLGDVEAAKDITQQVFLVLHERGGEIRHPERISSWLFTVARHACADQLESRGRYSSIEDSPPVESPANGSGDPEISRLILQAVSRLEPVYREVIILREYYGLPYTEIAEITATTVSTIKFRLFAARRHLAELLKPVFGKAPRLRD